MSNQKIRGMPCIVLRRSSSVGQGTSINNQGRTVEACIADNGLVVVDEVVLEGVSGSMPGNRSDIDQLVTRKKTKNDFKVLLVPDASRFTRAGLGHGQKLLFELRSVGILVYFVNEDLLVDNELAEMYVSFLFSAANQTAKQISRGSTIGNTNSFLDRRSPYAHRPPIGLDRMYSLDGKDLHIIRNLPDGTQHMLDPVTKDVIRVFEKNPEKGTPNHYLKQKNEVIRLVPGDPDRVAAVHLIFQLHLAEGLNGAQVAMRLNDQGIPSSEGKEWHTAIVHKVLRNPAYIGRGIRYRKKSGIYHNGGEADARPSGVTLEELAHCKEIRRELRPREQWRERPMPDLVDFLPENIRDLARHHIEQYLDEIAEGESARPRRDRHHQSNYLLKSVLRSKVGGYSMTGRLSGKEGYECRYYGVGRGNTVPKTGSKLRGRIRADALEKAVLEQLRAVLLNRPNLIDAIKSTISNTWSSKKMPSDAAQLRKELQRKSRQLALLSDAIGDDSTDDDPVLRKIEKVKEEKRRLAAQIRLSESMPERAAGDPFINIECITNRLEELARHVDTADTALLRNVVDVFVTRLDADLVTKEVEMEIAVPSWIGEVVSTVDKVGLEELFTRRPSVEAHPENAVILGKFQCKSVGRPQCYSCRRLEGTTAAMTGRGISAVAA